MVKHKLIMFIYFYIYVSISFFFAPYLINVKGFAPQSVGYLTTIGLFILIISFFLSGYIADKINSNKTIILVNLFMSFIVIAGLISFDSKVLLSICYVLSWSSFIMITSQLDGLVVRDISHEHYSKVRGYGSYGAAISYFLNSYALNSFSLGLNLTVNSLLILLLILLIILIDEKSYMKNANLQEYGYEIKKIIKIKPIIYILIITFLTYGTLSADDAYQVIYNLNVVGISASIMGIVGFLSIISEGTFMMLYQRLLTKIGIIKTIYIAVFVLFAIYITRFTMYTSPLIINVGSVLMGVFIGFYVPSAILIINRYVSNETKSLFLGLYQIMIRLGGMIIGLITTIFYDLTGSLQNIYLLHTIMIGLSFIFIIKLNKNLNGSNGEIGEV